MKATEIEEQIGKVLNIDAITPAQLILKQAVIMTLIWCTFEEAKTDLDADVATLIRVLDDSDSTASKS